MTGIVPDQDAVTEAVGIGTSIIGDGRIDRRSVQFVKAKHGIYGQAVLALELEVILNGKAGMLGIAFTSGDACNFGRARQTVVFKREFEEIISQLGILGGGMNIDTEQLHD